NVIEILIPPLRERREDLPALCAALLSRIAQESGMPVPAITERTLSAIAAHPLTGNVRELENLLHRAVALSDGDELHVDPPSGTAEAVAPRAAMAHLPSGTPAPNAGTAHVPPPSTLGSGVP